MSSFATEKKERKKKKKPGRKGEADIGGQNMQCSMDQRAGIAGGVACLGPHWLPGGSARRIKPWSVLPTFHSPRTQTKSTPLALSVQLLLCRVCGPQPQSHPKIDSQGLPEQGTGEGERDWDSSSSSLRVLICKMGR